MSEKPFPDGVTPTPDGHYLVIDGRKWRRTNPNIPEEERQRLVNELMDARRAVGSAQKAADKPAESAARARVHTAKVTLGERGPKWWESEPECVLIYCALIGKR